MKTNKLFEYFMQKGDLKSAMRIKKAFYMYQQPHQREIRSQERRNALILKLQQINNTNQVKKYEKI